MRIIGLDMATTTGFAFVNTLDDDDVYSSGIWVYKDGNKPLCLEERLFHFKDDLCRLCLEVDVDAVVYEQAHHRGGPATRSGLGMETVLRLTCWEHEIPVFPVHSGTLKKHATGSGNASKEDMCRAAADIVDHKYRMIDDNEADAVCLAHWGRECLSENGSGEISVKEAHRDAGSTGQTKAKEKA